MGTWICVCGKICFNSKEAARQERKHIKDTMLEELRVYYCERGKTFHLGHKGIGTTGGKIVQFRISPNSKTHKRPKQKRV